MAVGLRVYAALDREPHVFRSVPWGRGALLYLAICRCHVFGRMKLTVHCMNLPQLMGQGMPLSNLTAAANLVRATWPTAVIAYNEDFNVIASGFTGLNESVSTDPQWRLPAELDFFSVDYYCGFHQCYPHQCSTQPVPTSSYDPQCAAHLRHAYETVVYPRLAPRTKALLVPGAFAPFPGASSPPCPAWSAGPLCPNPLNASMATCECRTVFHAWQSLSCHTSADPS